LQSRMRRVEDLTPQFFNPQVGRPFRVTLAEGTLDLTLKSVNPLPPPRRLSPVGQPLPVTAPGIRTDPFTLLFVGPLSRPLVQSTYALTIDDQLLEIFVVPVGREPEGFLYQAVFG
jgi:hypothetical protein